MGEPWGEGGAAVAAQQGAHSALAAGPCAPSTLTSDIRRHPYFDSSATYPFHLVQNVTSSLNHLRLLIVVPVFTDLLVSCA